MIQWVKKVYALYKIGMLANWWEAINGPKPKPKQ